MAVVTFKKLWINVLSDPSICMGFRLTAFTSSPQAPSRVDQYGTVLRAITTGVTAQQIPYSAWCDTREQIDFLETYEGIGVCVRDPRGGKFGAIYSDLQIVEQLSPLVRVPATFTANEVSFSEAV